MLLERCNEEKRSKNGSKISAVGGCWVTGIRSELHTSPTLHPSARRLGEGGKLSEAQGGQTHTLTLSRPPFARSSSTTIQQAKEVQSERHTRLTKPLIYWYSTSRER